MPRSSGCNQVALVTRDLDTLIDFYRRIFDADVLVDLDEGEVRHALIDLGGGFSLHPFEFAGGNPHGVASDADFDRGHLDHLTVNVADADTFGVLRARLVEAGASDGTLIDYGRVRTVWFNDPDGMGCAIAMWADGAPRTFEDRIEEPYVTVAG